MERESDGRLTAMNIAKVKTNVFSPDVHTGDGKVYFRLGCASFGMLQYDDAVKALNMAQSLQPIGADGLPIKDAVIAKKLQEAIRLRDIEKKKEEMKYSRMFS